MPNNLKELKELMQSKSFRGILIGLGAAIVILLVFEAGALVGYRKAAFSFRFGNNYYRAFGDRGTVLFHMPLRGASMEAHGAAGNIVSVNLPTFVVADRDNVEKEVLIATGTVLRHFNSTIQPTDLKVGDFTVVFGEPNGSSQIEARLVRVLPSPEGGGYGN